MRFNWRFSSSRPLAGASLTSMPPVLAFPVVERLIADAQTPTELTCRRPSHALSAQRTRGRSDLLVGLCPRDLFGPRLTLEVCGEVHILDPLTIAMGLDR